jgi:hypothetical protein
MLIAQRVRVGSRTQIKVLKEEARYLENVCLWTYHQSRREAWEDQNIGCWYLMTVLIRHRVSS